MKIGKFKLSRKAVSPVIATLLMIAVAVAASVIVYVWSAGLLGTLMGGGGSQVKEQLIVEAYSWPSPGTTLTLYLRNTGSSPVKVDKVYVGGSTGSISATEIAVGASSPIPVGSVSGTVGVAYTVKIVTTTGGVFSFSCIYGSSG